MKRKTIKVDELKDQINSRIRECESEEGRKTLCHLLGNVLLQTGNYKGFNYIEWLEGGCERWRLDPRSQASDAENPNGLGSQVPQEFLGPEYLRRYY